MNNINKIFTKDPSMYAKDYLSYLIEIISSVDHKSIADVINSILQARIDGVNIFFIGNGGSAATASHFANDLSIGTKSYNKPFKALSLTDNVPLITAIANDFGYDEIFIRQLKILGKSGDLLVGISASGNSPNILKAFEFAKSSRMKTISLTGFDGGELKKISDLGIHINTPKNEYGPVEDLHMILDHLIGSYLMNYVSNEE